MPRYKLVNGERIQLTAEEEAQRDQEEADWEAGAFDRAIASSRQRRNAYGSWNEQLDEIYHDIDAWKARIAKVKSDNPKG